MKRLIAAIGIVVTLAPTAVAGANTPLYSTIRDLVESEKKYPDDVVSFTAQALTTDELQLAADDVRTVLEGNWYQICETYMLDLAIECPTLTAKIRQVADREMATIRLGHELQAIATNYELPILPFSQQPDKLTAAFANILKIWGIENLSLKGTSAVRLLPPPEDNSQVESAVQDVHSALNELIDGENEEERIAAVWRYQYGVQFVRNHSRETNPDGASGPDTERQYLFKRQEDVEGRLRLLIDILEPTIDPPLNPGELALFLLPAEPQEAQDNVVIWVMIRKPKVNNESAYDENYNPNPNYNPDEYDLEDLPTEDAGLRWAFPLEPVRPSILKESDDTMIPAGFYPPLPNKEDEGAWIQEGGGGLCKSLAGSNGYLCRPRVTQGEEGCPCQEDSQCGESGTCVQKPGTEEKYCKIDPKPNTILLTACRSLSSSSVSSGASGQSSSYDDVCKDKFFGAKSSDGSVLIASCQPGTETTYDYSILGHTCFIRTCAEQTRGHSIIPGQDPLVVQESTSPWGACMAAPKEYEPLVVAPSIYSHPPLPAYNPAARARELDIQYCQAHGKPPLSPPVLCQTDISQYLRRLQKEPTANGIRLLKELDRDEQDELQQGMPAYGAEAGADLYRDFIRQVSVALNGTFETTVQVLERIPKTSFPDTMCPMNYEDTLALCPADGSSTSQ